MSKNKLLAEEIKKFKLLSEYSFFIPDVEDEVLEEDDEEIGDEEPMDAPEADGAEGGEEPDLSFDGEEIDPEMDVEEPGAEGGEEMAEPDMEDLPEPEGDINVGDEPAPEAEPEMDSGEEEVELDITQLVDKSEEAVESSEEANEKISMLMKKFAELEERMPVMDQLGQKLEDLQKDIAKRNPTEVEKLEMRSMSSFPYNIKLSDYWNDKMDSNTNYDVGTEAQPKENEEEYVLRKQDIDSDYSENSIKNTFDYTEEDV